MNVRKLIEEYFLINDSKTGALVPLKFNHVQDKYWKILINDYGQEFWDKDVDEIDLKARKEGFTSFWLAIFSAIAILSRTAKRFLEISYREDATKQHFRQIKQFHLSTLTHDTKKWDSPLERKYFESITEGSELVLRDNKSSQYVGSATSRTGERGGTVQGVLFTEGAHYPDTGIISASEIIEGTRQMLSVGSGIKVVETTANGWNHFKKRWDQATSGEISAKPRFFGWREFYTDEQFEQIKLGFSDKSLIPQEYPESADDAFLSTGRPAFNQTRLKQILKTCTLPRYVGEIEDDGFTVKLREGAEGLLKIWKVPKEGRSYIVSADVAEGIDGRAYSVAEVFDRSSWEQVAVWRGRIDPSQFGAKLVDIATWYNDGLIIPENNNHGWATIAKIKDLEYPHLFRTRDIWPDGEQDKDGFPTNERTRNLIMSALRNSVEDLSVYFNDEITVKEIIGCVIDDKGKVVANPGYFMDTVIASAIGIYSLKFFTLDDTYRDGVVKNVRGPVMVTRNRREEIKHVSRTGYR